MTERACPFARILRSLEDGGQMEAVKIRLTQEADEPCWYLFLRVVNEDGVVDRQCVLTSREDLSRFLPYWKQVALRMNDPLLRLCQNEWWL